MLERMKKIIITVLAVFGVLFLILLLIPSDDEEEDNTVAVEETDTSRDEEEEAEEKEAEEKEEREASKEEAEEDEKKDDAKKDDEQKYDPDAFWEEVEARKEEESEESKPDKEDANVAEVSIPSGDTSDFALRFKTTDLNNEKMSQDIFSDYDLTVVYFWGTYCSTCKAEIGSYENLYEKLPDNVNLIGVLNDVYDGVDTNVSDAEDILSGVDASFANLRRSDSMYDFLSGFQYIPSAFFVDSEGHVVGEPMSPAYYEDVISELKKYLK